MSPSIQRLWLMSGLLLLLVLVTTARAERASRPQSPERPPDLIASADGDRPLWVSEQRARSDDGQLDWSLFSPLEQQVMRTSLQNYERRRARGQVGRSGDPCAGAGGMQAHYVVERPSLEQLIVHSEAIFSGRVGSGEPGLAGGSPRAVYTVRVVRVWKGDGAVEPGGTVLLAHPDAAIAVGGAWLCNRSVRHPDRPHPGRRVLVFSHKPPDSAYRIYDPIDEELFLETSHGLSPPLHLVEELSSLTFDELEDRLTDLVGAPETAP